MLKGIIFDFDGVIAESVQVKTDAFAALYMTYGEDIVDRVVEHHESNGGISRFEKIKIYHGSFLNKTITARGITDLANQFSELVVEKVIAAPYVLGALEYIQKCYKHYKLFISTGTPTEEMKQILEGRKIAQYFTDVFGSPVKKNDHIKYIVSKYNISSNELLFYGDSNTDLNVAEEENIPFILIKNRFNEKLVKNYQGKIISNFRSLT